MPENDAGHGVDVNIGDCRCPGSPRPHQDGDIVTLVPKLTLPMAASLKARVGIGNELTQDISIVGVQYSLVAGYLQKAPFGAIESWSLLEEGPVIDRKTGELPLIPVPITPENIERLIPWANGGEEVAEKADDLYRADFLTPFLRKTSLSLNGGQTVGRTAGSTSATRKSGPSRRSPSRPSLRPVSDGRKSA